MRSPRGFLAALCLALLGCVPRLQPLAGTPAPSRLPAPDLPLGHRQILFTWELEDPEMRGRGDGVARIAPPDSVRLDFFLSGGFGSGAAVVVGDSVRLPSSDLARRMVPPPPLLWSALGRSALPALADTAVRIDGPLLRADLGRPVEWRATFRGDSLIRVDRVQARRIVEWLDRGDDGVLRYRNEPARRAITIRITSSFEVSGFDADIWRVVP